MKTFNKKCKTCGEGNRIVSIDFYPIDKFADLERSICGTCVSEELQNKIVKNAPESERAQETIKKRLRRAEIKAYAEDMKNPEKSLGKYSYLFLDKGKKWN